MLIGVGLVVAERKSGGGHTEYNCAAGVCDEVGGCVWGWGRVAGVPPWLPCIGKCENDVAGILGIVKKSGPDAEHCVEAGGGRVGAANTRIVKTIRRRENVQLEFMFVPRRPPIDFEVVWKCRWRAKGRGSGTIAPAVEFKAVRDTVVIIHLRRDDLVGGLEHASPTRHSTWTYPG